jgi:hypothetical protein
MVLEMAESFGQIAEDLPFVTRVFTDFQLAEEWVKETESSICT